MSPTGSCILAGGAVLEDCGNCETWVADRHRQLWAQHNRDSLALFLVSLLFSDPLRCNSLYHKLYLPKQVILDCVFSNHEPRCNSSTWTASERHLVTQQLSKAPDKGGGKWNRVGCDQWSLGFFEDPRVFRCAMHQNRRFVKTEPQVRGCLLINQSLVFRSSWTPCLALPSGKQYWQRSIGTNGLQQTSEDMSGWCIWQQQSSWA